MASEVTLGTGKRGYHPRQLERGKYGGGACKGDFYDFISFFFERGERREAEKEKHASHKRPVQGLNPQPRRVP